MSWTADSTHISADSTCFTADGGSCLKGDTESPIGPGYLIYFQPPPRQGDGIVRKQPIVDKYGRLLKQEDDEIIEFIKIIITSGVI